MCATFAVEFLHLLTLLCVLVVVCVTLQGHWTICCFLQQDGRTLGHSGGAQTGRPRDMAVGISWSDYCTGLAYCVPPFVYLCHPSWMFSASNEMYKYLRSSMRSRCQANSRTG